MKKISLSLLLLCSLNVLFGQNFSLNINNKGNRLQTYPKVTETNSAIMDMINQVDTIKLESDIQWMQDLGCRDAQSSEALQTQNWLVERFEDLGLETYLHFFPCGNSYWGHCTEQLCNGDTLDAGNVVAIQYGTKYPDEIIIVSSHYDHPDGPGADDNASGTAGVLETARILSQYEFDRTIMYVPFNAEEYWMVGSMPFAQKCAMEDMNILGVFNYDMIGFFPVEMGDITMSSGSSPISQRLWEFYYTVANIYIPQVPTFRFTSGDSYGGDHMPFNIYEYPALYIGDTEYHHIHPCYHKLCDTIGNGVNNFKLAESFVKAVIASVAELANGYLPPQNFVAIPSENNIFLSWDEVENSSYKLFRDNILIAEIDDNFYLDEDVYQDLEYEYYVIGVRNDNFESDESNHDFAKISNSLNLPYHNDFETTDDLSDFRFYNEEWTISNNNPQSGNSSVCNTNFTSIQDNYLTLAELNWFAIKDTITDISLSFYYKGNISSIWFNANFFVEITTDRVRWDKLLKINGTQSQWKQYELSLNDYIDNDFVQIRFRLEASGSEDYAYLKRIFIDNLKIEYESSGVSIQTYESLKFEDVKIYPNPSKGEINISTGLDKEYNIVVYNISGNKVYEINNFRDGKLDLSHLNNGMYFIRINTQENSVAKKVKIEN
ncbi:M28 family peptidase [Bacteroidales bacterium OttesenSCG-928-K03]|nr:M28 family peptidase [Bacteroidales bacterium OttesenSCG-928-L14]MDL2242676.1 M28 family peptidase [Bacteroidales bacterium OttesenSCG-928-K03]